MNYNGMSDREILIRLDTKMSEAEKARIERNEQNEKKFDALFDEDGKLHHRINDVHSRVNIIKFWSIGSAGVGSFFGAIAAWFTSK